MIRTAEGPPTASLEWLSERTGLTDDGNTARSLAFPERPTYLRSTHAIPLSVAMAPNRES